MLNSNEHHLRGSCNFLLSKLYSSMLLNLLNSVSSKACEDLHLIKYSFLHMDFSCLHNTWSNGILMRLFSGTEPGYRRQRRPSLCPGPLPPFEDVSSGTSTKGSLLESAGNKIRRSTRVGDLPFYPHLLRLEDHRGVCLLKTA
ncbi:hypothetical protein T12_16637 [Trichinella patagoniensis]|uniref:Uncharacterized protein n=1 Tax=Trichinella patagoniensis TaxID=990121 RepID=A0A0V0ZD00_9BILA|nr:hypothetical protein T12_16637 [Trichinella patagoniensis]